MRKPIGILITIGLIFTTLVFGETVLVGLNDIDYQSFPDWREGMIERKRELFFEEMLHYKAYMKD